METLKDITAEQIEKIQKDYDFDYLQSWELMDLYNQYSDKEIEIGIAIIDYFHEKRKEDNIEFLTTCVF